MVYAIYQALCILDRQQECGHKYTIFSDSTAAIDINRVRMDTTGPGLRLAIAAREVCSRVLGRDNEVTTRWVPAHTGIRATKGRTSMPRQQPEMRLPTARSPKNTGGRQAYPI